MIRINILLILVMASLTGCTFDNIGFEGRIKLEGLVSSIVGIDIHIKAGAFKYPEGVVDENEASSDADDAGSIWGYL